MEKYITRLIANGLQLLSNVATIKGVNWINRATGIDITKDVLTIEELTVLKQYEMENEEELLDITVNKYTINVPSPEGLEAARSTQKELMKEDDLFIRRFLYYLTTFWSLFSALYIVLITFIDISPQATRFADTILGFMLGTLIATMITYFYGSSRGSALNGEAIRGALKDATSK